MGRSQRRRSGRIVHYPRPPEELFNQNGRWCNDAGQPLFRIKPLCSEEYVFEDVTSAEMPVFRHSDYQKFSTDPEDYRMCPQCQSKALHKRDGGKVGTYKLMDRLDFSKPEFERKYRDGKYQPTKWGLERHAWKSVYPVMDVSVLADDEEDKIVAFIVIDNGWGKAWEIHGWDAGRENDDPPRMCPHAAKWTSVSKAWTARDGQEFPERETEMEAKGINSKELALLRVPDMLERKHLKSHAEIVEFARKFKETQEALAQRRRDEADERNRLIAERNRRDAEDKAEIAEALREIATLDLTNFQRDGLLRAAKRLGIDMDVEPTMLAVMASDAKIEDTEDGWRF